MKALLVAAVGLLLVSAAVAAPLPGVKTPSRNISCFYVPIKPTARGTLLCDIHHASYLAAVLARGSWNPLPRSWCRAIGLRAAAFLSFLLGTGKINCDADGWFMVMPAFVEKGVGLSEEEAMAMIVRGFVEPIARELPMEYALELNRLIELQMEGAVG